MGEAKEKKRKKAKLDVEDALSKIKSNLDNVTQTLKSNKSKSIGNLRAEVSDFDNPYLARDR